MTRGRWSLLLVLALAGAAVGGLAILARTSNERVEIAAPAASPSSPTPRPGLATPAQVPTGPRFAAFDCTKPAGLAARVDATPIQLADLCARLQRLGGVTPKGTVRQQARHVLDRMIDAMLVRRALDQSGAAVTEAELSAAMPPSIGADVDLLRALPARDAPNADAAADAAARARAEAFIKNPSGIAAGMAPLSPFVVGETGIEPALEAAASSLPKGQWSTALRTRVGYAVIRVIGTSAGEALDAPALRTRVRSALETRKLGAAQQRVLEALRAAASIELLVDV